MAAPTLTNGITRAIGVVAIPSVVMIALVSGANVVYDPQTAGIVYIGMTVFVLLGIYTAAKYWNTMYTIGFVGCGVAAWGGVPGIMPELVPAQFANLGKFIVLLFLVGVGLRILDKR